MMKQDRSEERGIAMLIVVLIVALGMTGALVLSGMVNVDIGIVGNFRRANEVRDTSVGGAGQAVVALSESTEFTGVIPTEEVLNELRAGVREDLGLGDDQEVQVEVIPLRTSDGGCGKDTGHGTLTGLWYEARIRSQMGSEAVDETRVEFCRTLAIAETNLHFNAGR